MGSYAMQAETEMWDAIVASDTPPAKPPRAKVAARKVDDWPNHYSARNCLILAAAGASEVAGYREWQQLGRQVRKGEHGIQIAAPVTVKDRETGDSKVVNMKHATVFDVSQTDPKEGA